MNLILGIVSFIIISYVRIWFINNFGKHKNYNKKILVPVFFFACLSVLLIFLFPEFLNIIGIQGGFVLESLSLKISLLFLFYCLSFVVLIGIMKKTLIKNQFLKLFVVLGLFFLSIILGGFIGGLNTIIMYYLISVYSEEFVKISITNNINIQNKSVDLIFLAILVALGFSLTETLIYVVVSSVSGGENSILLGFGRGIFTTLIHVISTGLIAYFISKVYIKKLQFSYIIIGFVLGLGVHILYNLSIVYNFTIGTVFLVVLGYFIFSFLLFNSDSVYLEVATKKKLKEV